MEWLPRGGGGEGLGCPLVVGGVEWLPRGVVGRGWAAPGLWVVRKTGQH